MSFQPVAGAHQGINDAGASLVGLLEWAPGFITGGIHTIVLYGFFLCATSGAIFLIGFLIRSYQDA